MLLFNQQKILDLCLSTFFHRQISMESLPLFTFFSSWLIFSVINLSYAIDTLTSKRPIRDGETLISPSQRFKLGFFSPGNSKKWYLGIWYKNSPDTVVWVANRNNPATDQFGALTFGNNGNLVLLNQTKSVIWSSNVSRIVADPIARLLDSGNLVVMDKNSSKRTESYQWQSFDHPTDTLLPGMKLGWNFKSDHETHITSWRSTDDPSSGDFTLRLDIQGLAQLVTVTRSAKKLRSGPWNGIFFGGTLSLKNSVFKPVVVHQKDEFYYMSEPLNESVITRLTITQTGLMQRFVMNNGNGGWTLLYSLPEDLCDNYGECGANAICKMNRAPVCQCLKGFTPKSQGEVDIQNWSESRKCEKKLTLNCQREEGFLKLAWIKLPDMLDYQLNENLSLKECKMECAKNCSCRAYANSNTNGGSSGSGCLMWFGDLIDIREQLGAFGGQDIYIRVPASELDKKKRPEIIVAISISTMSGIFILALVFCISWNKTKRKGMETRKGDAEVPLFDLGTIVSATNNFSQANVLGAGGFGSVYKGKLISGREIAVKKLSKNSGQGIEEFRNEVVLIAKLQHRNLVGLLGCCIQGEDRMLIYEYMPNKSLDYFIFDHKRSASLAWKERFKIVLGIARGLLYLHQDSKLQIVHRDLKPSNILLDSNFNPKISDFGLARIFGDDDKEAKTKRVIGTYGYMSPEYAIDGTFSIKSDVFSLGVLLLEIVSGKKNRGFCHPDHHHNLLGHVWLLWNEGRAFELIDAGLEGSCVKSQVLRCIQLGLLCVQRLPEDRPAMSSVVFMLANEEAVLPQPKHPGFFIERSSILDTTPGNEERYSTNTVTITVLDGR